MEQPSRPSGHGALIGSVIIIAILILGGIYILKETKDMKHESGVSQQQMESDTQFEQTQTTQGNSDDVDSIEADVNATDVDSIDEGL